MPYFGPMGGRNSRPGGSDPLHYASFVIKVFPDTGDDAVVSIGDSAFVWAIPDDLEVPEGYTEGWNLTHAAAFVSTASSSGVVEVQIRNVTTGLDMLSTKVTIDANEMTSYSAATPPVINLSNDHVTKGDLIAIDVDNAGTGAEGLGVILRFEL